MIVLSFCILLRVNVSPYYWFPWSSFLVLSFPLCVGALVSSGLILSGGFCFPSLCTPSSLPSRCMVVSILPNGTSHVALSSHAGITILSELLHAQELVLCQQPSLLPPRTAAAVASCSPRSGHSLFHMRVLVQAVLYVAGWLFPSVITEVWDLHYSPQWNPSHS